MLSRGPPFVDVSVCAVINRSLAVGTALTHKDRDNKMGIENAELLNRGSSSLIKARVAVAHYILGRRMVSECSTNRKRAEDQTYRKLAFHAFSTELF